MKILMINKTDSLGGAAQVMQNLMNGLRSKGHEARALVRRKFTDDTDVFELNDGLLTGFARRITGRDVPIVWGNMRDMVLANDIDHGKSDEIKGHPLIEWADVVHCHNLHGNYFKLQNLIEISSKKPVVWTWHDWWPATGHCATPMECKRFEIGCGNCPNLRTYQTILWDNTARLWQKKREIYNQSKLVITVPSQTMKEAVSGVGLPIKKVPNGINVIQNNFSKAELRKKLNLPDDRKIVMFVNYGSRNIDKGSDFVDKLVSKNNRYYWLGVGSKNQGEVGGIHYVPHVSQEKLNWHLKASDAFVFPSLFESFGMTPVESLIAGTPVVAFPVGVVPELIDHKKTGYIARYKDFSDLDTGLEYVLKNKIQPISKSLEHDFSAAVMTDNFIKLYETT